jgi:SAM-dependent methyltransferase
VNKKFKVSYSYPLEYPVKVVIKRLGLLGLVGWFYQKYAGRAEWNDIVLSERILEVPTFHQWFGKLFPKPAQQKVLEIGHVASDIALQLANEGFSVTGIDLRKYPFVHKNLTSIVEDFLKHDFSETFDCIYSLSTIEHFGISERYGGEGSKENNLDEEAFKKISKLLSQNGHAIISVPYARAWVSGIWFKVYTRELIEKKLGTVFTIIEKRYYRRDNNEWSAVSELSKDPASPHDGVAMFLLLKKHSNL